MPPQRRSTRSRQTGRPTPQLTLSLDTTTIDLTIAQHVTDALTTYEAIK